MRMNDFPFPSLLRTTKNIPYMAIVSDLKRKSAKEAAAARNTLIAGRFCENVTGT
jgi:hypothetical protein